MSNVLKYLGTVILLIGVAILAVPALTGGLSNNILLVGLCVVIAGYLVHITLGRRLG
jgi:hypothetical protein